MSFRTTLETAKSLPEAFRRAAGRTLNGMRLHDVRRVEEAGRTWYSKRRLRLTETTLFAVNAYLSTFGLDVRFLRGHEWAGWETSLHAALHGTVVVRKPGLLLLLPEVRGIPLDAYVRMPGVTDAQREEALLAATTSLAALHRTCVQLPAGGNWALSHGDAVLRNVLFDPSDGTAHWIDFETRHELGAPADRRRADDVWTFARSAVFHLGDQTATRVADVVAATCMDGAVRTALQSGLTARRVGANLFRLAQAPLPGATVDRLASALAR